jgi:hypothetical protein
MRLSTFRSWTLTALTGTLFIISGPGCSKNEKNDPYANFYLSATSNGQLFDAQSVSGQYSPSTGIATIIAPLDEKITLQIDIRDSMSLNTPIPFTGGTSMYYTSTWTPALGGGTFTGDTFNGHGTVTITAWNKPAQYITCTFSGVLVGTGSSQGDSTVITSGKFNSPYTLIP